MIVHFGKIEEKFGERLGIICRDEKKWKAV